MEGMEAFPADFRQPFTVSLSHMKSCHIRLFGDNVPFHQKYWRFVTMTAIELFNIASMWMYIFRVIGSQVNNVRDMAVTAAAALIGLQSFLKAMVLLQRTTEIEDLIKGLAMAWKTENLSDIQIKIKNQRVKELNFGLSVYHLAYYYVGSGCLLVTLCSQLSTEFALLREDMKNAVPMPNRDIITEVSMVEKNRRIETMIENHQELIKLAHSLNHIFNRTIFIDLCFFAIIICFFAMSLAISHEAIDKLMNIVSIVAMLTIVYLVCYYCEMLKEESEGIAEAAYENLWYKGGTHYQKTIGFIIMRAQRPCYVTSLNYVPITLNTFTKVVSTTWSYFSLMMTMYGDT